MGFKIAISGKGGVGKTTVAGVMARVLARRGQKVLVIDADPDSNLAAVIGVEESLLQTIRPLAQMDEFIKERTEKKGEYGGFFKLNPRVDDIPETFSVEKDGVRLLVLGTIPRGGGGCFCAENALLKGLLSHVLIERDEWVIVDMEAGLEHLGRGSTAYLDAFIVVVEPGKRSIQTARNVEKLAADLGVSTVCVVGNKIRNDGDKRFIEENISDSPILGYLGFSEAVLDSDMKGAIPDQGDGTIAGEVAVIVDRLIEVIP